MRAPNTTMAGCSSWAAASATRGRPRSHPAPQSAAGAGLVHLAVRRAAYTRSRRSKTTRPWFTPLPAEEAEGTIAAAALPRLQGLAERCDVLAIGPGLGRSGGVIEVVRSLAGASRDRSCSDADALWALARLEDGFLAPLKRPAVLTPHEGEV